MPQKNNIKQLIKRFLAAFLIASSIITVSILANQFGPHPYIYSDDDWENLDPIKPYGYNSTKFNVVFDQHSHTIHSDGVLTVKQNVEWHIAMGFNAMAITDHNTLAQKADIDEIKDEYKDDGLIIILGMEWTTDRIHMNFIGIDEWDLSIPRNPSDKDIQNAIDEVHDQNGIVTVNHIPWSKDDAGMDDHPSRDELLEWGVDYIEIVNGRTYDKNSVDWMESLDPVDRAKIGMITGTDMHEPGSVYGWTFINALSLSENAIMDELRALRTNISYSSEPYEDESVHQRNPLYVIMLPLIQFGGLFVPLWRDNSLDWVVALVYISYFVMIFAVSELYRYYKPKYLNKKAEKTGDRNIESENLNEQKQ